MTTDQQTLPPEIWAIITGLAAILLRWLEKKLLSDKAKKIQEQLEEAKRNAQSFETISRIQGAINNNEKLIKTLSPTKFPNSFTKK